MGSCDFEANELIQALKDTFNTRGTNFTDIVAFEPDFYTDQSRSSQWNSFIKKKRANTIVEFRVAVIEIKKFLEPIISAVDHHETIQCKWIASRKSWVSNI